MRILITGAAGLLGSAVAKAAKRRKHDVIGIVGNSDTSIEGLSQKTSIDLSDPIATERIILDTFPDAIVNCAAISIPSQCEQSPETSKKVNVELPEKLALLSRHLFGKMVHLSTDMIFDGASAPYSNKDEPSPTNEYAKQKAESEKRVLSIAPENSIVLRISLINGNSPSGERSLHERLFADWAAGKTTSLFENEFRQPVSVDNAADAIVELVERDDVKGIYHWAGSERLSRYQMGKAILCQFGLPDSLIQSARSDQDPKFANRPKDLGFDLDPLSGLLKTQAQSFASQLDSLIVPHPFRDWYNQQ